MTESERDTLATDCVDMLMRYPGVVVPFDVQRSLTTLIRTSLDVAYAAGKVDGGDQVSAAVDEVFEKYQAAGASPSGGQDLP
jgi:hypothetical protein